ncbi:unnamed protein product [Effrenium voratum]|nr:unnamed protein product [Effrenium voratum]
MAAPATGQDAPAQVAEVCECGNMFMPDSNFCRQCGAPRKGTAAMAFASAPVASPPTLAPGSSFAEATAEQASPNSSVHLQVLVLLGEKWLWAHGAAELVLLLAKNLKFDYPPGWALAELAMIAVYLLVQILHRSSGSFANRAKSTSSMAFFLGLCGMLVLLAGYLTALQVYVMQVEFAMGLVSMSLLGCQLVLGTFAGQRHAARPKLALPVIRRCIFIERNAGAGQGTWCFSISLLLWQWQLQSQLWSLTRQHTHSAQSKCTQH